MSPFYALMQRARAARTPPPYAGASKRARRSATFRFWKSSTRQGATDYLTQLFIYGEKGDRSQGSGIAYSFATDRKGGFSDDDTTLVQATLPALSLAMKAHAGHVIASGLLGTYLGEDVGRRIHTGSIMRGSVDNLRAVLWYADIRGFTPLSDSAPGPVVVELLNDVFEILTASLRERGGQVLKFIGDAMLATFPFDDADRAETCRRALDAAIEAMRNIEALNARAPLQAAPSPRSISRSILGTCCMATSARSIGSISRSLVRRSTRWRASRRFASRWAARCWFPPNSSPE